MRKSTKSRLVLLYGAFLFGTFPAVMFGCPSNPAPTPPNDVTDVVVTTTDAAPPPLVADADKPNLDDCQKACINLRRLGCPEGLEDAGQGCTSVCEHTASSKLFNMKPACLAAAANVAAAKACGSVSCQ